MRRIPVKSLFLAWCVTIVSISLATLVSAAPSGNPGKLAEVVQTGTYKGAFVEGEGDLAILEAINAAYESTQPSAKMACLPLLYKRDWDGFVEGNHWPCWWIQNSYGPSYSVMPFLGEPYATWMEHSQGMWFRLMGDDKRKDRSHDFVAPDGCLCDAAYFHLSGGNINGFGDPRPECGPPKAHHPGPIDGSIVDSGAWYRQGDGDSRQWDWFMGATAGGLVLESERLLVRHDAAAAKKRLPELERGAAFLDSRRDPKSNLLWAGSSANLLAPGFLGKRNPDGSFVHTPLTELSVNYVAGLERFAEVCKLCGETEKAAAYLATAAKVRSGLPHLMTPEGYFIKSEDPDGTRHGVFGAAKHGYFETVPNSDSGCFRVTSDAENKKIVRYMLDLKGKAAPGGLAPNGVILPNYPGYDDTITINQNFGTFMNGTYWPTVQARMNVACLRADEFAHPFGSWAKDRLLFEGYRVEQPSFGFGTCFAPAQLNYPFNLLYDDWGVPTGLLRGLFEYDYRADGLRVRPHLPATVMRFVQKFPVFFGKTKIYLTVTGTGECGWTELHPTGKPGTLAVELVRGGAKPQGAWQPPAEKPLEFHIETPVVNPAVPEVDMAKINAFYRAMCADGLQDTYEAAQARTVLELLLAHDARKKNPPPLPTIKNCPPCNLKAVETLYLNQATYMAGGLLDRLKGRDLWKEPVDPRILDVARKNGL